MIKIWTKLRETFFRSSKTLSSTLLFILLLTVTGWGGHLFRRFCNMFSKSSPCLFGQHVSCSIAQRHVELSENSLQNLRNKWPPHPVHCTQFRGEEQWWMSMWKDSIAFAACGITRYLVNTFATIARSVECFCIIVLTH